MEEGEGTPNVPSGRRKSPVMKAVLVQANIRQVPAHVRSNHLSRGTNRSRNDFRRDIDPDGIINLINKLMLHFSREVFQLLVDRTGKLDEPGRMCREVASIVACLFACFLLALFITFVPSKVPSKVLFTFDGILLTKVFI